MSGKRKVNQEKQRNGARSMVRRLQDLTRRCAALEHDVALLSADHHMRQLFRRIAKLEERDQ